MVIAGLQKMTLLDYPGKVACTVFLRGCNFRCPFCHNSGILDGSVQPALTQPELLAFLEKRRGILDGVCITGGEPTLQPGLKELLSPIKARGFNLKLDTNGSRPEVLKEMVLEGLVDYVAMDIKNCPSRYDETAGAQGTAACVEESMRFLLTGAVDYEFRTTVVEEFHDAAAMEEMRQWLKNLAPDTKAKRIFIQPYMDRDSVLQQGLHTPSAEKLRIFAEILAPCAETITIRAMD